MFKNLCGTRKKKIAFLVLYFIFDKYYINALLHFTNLLFIKSCNYTTIIISGLGLHFELIKYYWLLKNQIIYKMVLKNRLFKKATTTTKQIVRLPQIY